jgi:hypothetical protein
MNAAHREGIHGIVPRYRENPLNISHYDVLALPENTKPRFFECTNCVQMWNAGTLTISRRFRPREHPGPRQLGHCFQVFANRIPDIR